MLIPVKYLAKQRAIQALKEVSGHLTNGLRKISILISRRRKKQKTVWATRIKGAAGPNQCSGEFFLRRRRGIKMVRFFDSQAFFGYFFGHKKVTKPRIKNRFCLRTLLPRHAWCFHQVQSRAETILEILTPLCPWWKHQAWRQLYLASHPALCSDGSFLCAPGTGANSAVEVRYTLGSEEC